MVSSMEEMKTVGKLVETRNNLGSFPVTHHTEENLHSASAVAASNSAESSALDRIAALRQQFISFRKQSEVMNI